MTPSIVSARYLVLGWGTSRCGAMGFSSAALERGDPAEAIVAGIRLEIDPTTAAGSILFIVILVVPFGHRRLSSWRGDDAPSAAAHPRTRRRYLLSPGLGPSCAQVEPLGALRPRCIFRMPAPTIRPAVASTAPRLTPSPRLTIFGAKPSCPGAATTRRRASGRRGQTCRR